MTAATEARSAPRLTFGGVLRSEWIKLVTVRSTVWCLAIAAAVTILLGLLLAFAFPVPDVVSDALAQQTAVQVATVSIGFSQLAVVVLGSLVITGEYGTGMIRSTFTAVPGRLASIAAKAIVFAVVVFVVSLIAIAIAAGLTALILPARDVSPDFGDPALLGALVGGAGYLALIGVFGFAVGTILRASAGAIAAALGVVLVLPGVLALLGGILSSTVLTNLATFLPTGAASMYAYDPSPQPGSDLITLTGWEGLALLLAWDVVLLVVGAVLVRRRDV